MAQHEGRLKGLREEAQKAIAAGEAFSEGYPELRDLLDAGMPEWMAEAAYARIRAHAQRYGYETVAIGEWQDFVQKYASVANVIGIGPY